ncbi:MAG: 4Fe-4S dicluster domain-containing protein [Candidatus Omnitrophota bacterium]
MLHSITRKNLIDLLERLSKDNDVFVPYRSNDAFYFDAFDLARAASIEIGGVRQSQPLKTFLNHAREKVIGASPESASKRENIIVGVKACDLASLKIQDYVFKEGDFKDPFYIDSRERLIIITSDCTEPKETCFCIALDGKPYPERGFDINLSPLTTRDSDSFLVEAATDRGRKIVDDYKTFFTESDDGKRALVNDLRNDSTEKVNTFIQERGFQKKGPLNDSVKKGFGNDTFWDEMASTCVECGACNLVCPTCHCFLLFDQKNEKSVERLRVWDSCLYKSFARVAGNANPRKHLRERLRNRIDKKFGFFPEVLDTYACTGCGRCVEACPGKIDIREILKGLVNGTWSKPPHK